MPLPDLIRSLSPFEASDKNLDQALTEFGASFDQKKKRNVWHDLNPFLPMVPRLVQGFMLMKTVEIHSWIYGRLYL